MNEIKDSGKTQQFASGAHRDTDEGKGDFSLFPFEALRRIAIIFQQGGPKKYGRNNWKKGMPVQRYLDSAQRHISKYLDGQRDEDHLAMAGWGVMCAIWTAWRFPELQLDCIECGVGPQGPKGPNPGEPDHHNDCSLKTPNPDLNKPSGGLSLS